MKNKIEIKQGRTYIVKEKKIGYSGYTYIKYLIEELTEFTVLIKNLDVSNSGLFLGSGKQRMSIVDFHTKYEVLEEILSADEKILRKNDHADV